MESFYLINEINRLRSEINRFLSNFFNSVKEINRFRKETKGLLNKEMPNIYLKVTIETFLNNAYIIELF